jgi:hypothetical protein
MQIRDAKCILENFTVFCFQETWTILRLLYFTRCTFVEKKQYEWLKEIRKHIAITACSRHRILVLSDTTRRHFTLYYLTPRVVTSLCIIWHHASSLHFVLSDTTRRHFTLYYLTPRVVTSLTNVSHDIRQPALAAIAVCRESMVHVSYFNVLLLTLNIIKYYSQNTFF